MRIGLIEIDSILPNLALMKLSAYHKALGHEVEFAEDGRNYDKLFASAIFSKSTAKCEELIRRYGKDIEIGGSGWSLDKDLPADIEYTKPDYSLYDAGRVARRIRGIMSKERRLTKAKETVMAGIGFTSRGCIRNCPFCIVPQKEGCFRQHSEIRDIINPLSNTIILHDNNFTADPCCIEKLQEIRERNLTVDINQGIDVRLMTEEKAAALSSVRHLRSVHFAWDLMENEKSVMEGTSILLRYIRPYRLMCFMLVGFNTTFEEDQYRYQKLRELGIDPYVMRYNNRKDDIRLNHFTRWVNGRFCTGSPFEEYLPWIKARSKSAISAVDRR